jgi:D-arabinonate dehydratase
LIKIKAINTVLLFEKYKSPIVSGRGALHGRDVLIIEIETNQDITGISFVTGLHICGGSEIKLIQSAITQALVPLLVGENPLNTQRLWDKMYYETRRFGRRSLVIRALSALDIALWDIVGKVSGLPISKLLGGNSDYVPLYVSGGSYSDDATLVTELEGYLKKGYPLIKIRVGGDTFKRDTERVRLARKTIGEDIKLAVDVGEAWDLSTAIQAFTRWQEFDLAWIEEPLSADNIDGLSRIRNMTSIPIATGESLYTRFAFRTLVEAKAVDIMQPDVTRVGGITEWIRIAHYASAYDIKLAPHGVQEIHTGLLGATSNTLSVEFFEATHSFQSLLDRIFIEPKCTKTLVNGCLEVPQLPGIGLCVDWDEAKRYIVH